MFYFCDSNGAKPYKKEVLKLIFLPFFVFMNLHLANSYRQLFCPLAGKHQYILNSLVRIAMEQCFWTTVQFAISIIKFCQAVFKDIIRSYTYKCKHVILWMVTIVYNYRKF
ncbi:hypothetical protein HBA_0603 [Sodalis endosymbiont of Henestaris halophilus]|nr:hypothetical protein HBA_0603 [Sodalis endosymbiont of Henestaris halophilus]